MTAGHSINTKEFSRKTGSWPVVALGWQLIATFLHLVLSFIISHFVKRQRNPDFKGEMTLRDVGVLSK